MTSHFFLTGPPPPILPGKVEEDTGTEESPFLRLLDRQSEDPFEAETENGQPEVPVVFVAFHVDNSGGSDEVNDGM